MALALVLVGILIIATGIEGTEHQLGAQLAQDLYGSNGFLVWMASIVIIGLLSKIPGFDGPAKALLALIFAVIILGNPDFIGNLAQGIISASPAQGQPLQTGSSSSSGGSGGSGGGSGSEVSELSTIASLAALA
jgi:hypothetical protein